MDLNLTHHPRTRALIAAAALSTLLGVALADETRTGNAPAGKSAKPAVKQLDLRPPDVTTLLTPQQIHQLLAKTLADDIEGVEVEGTRDLPPPSTPRVWGGIAAPFWALLHPTQAWRILAPLPPDQARRINNEAPDATRTFIEPAAPINP